MFINHLLELLDLYPTIWIDHMLVHNPNLTLDYVIEHFPNLLKHAALHTNPSISTPSNIANPKYKLPIHWKYPLVLCSSSFSEKDILQYLQGSMNNQELIVAFVMHNHNITSCFFDHIDPNVKTQLEKYWYFLGHNEHLTEKVFKYLYSNGFEDCLERDNDLRIRRFNGAMLLNRKLTIPMFRCLYSNSVNLINYSTYMTHNPNVLQSYADTMYVNNYNWYSENVNSTISIMFQHQPKLTNRITNNPNLLFEDLLLLLENKPYAYRYDTIQNYSSNHNMTWEGVCDFGWSNWNWKEIHKNSFTKSKKYYRETKLMRELWDTFQIKLNYLELVELL